ncbi:PIG-L deacetylase family protein [Tepidanaerobacter syntrophicus]|uniref:PIG-L deacetylase family protein n=1 Tax=Tepidanaerobacter syntrophicus TaxID=224999 RepID=UPI001BD6DD53|nr:PIG-L family deacetylase [Tepidanaerobacter syntrophicus]
MIFKKSRNYSVILLLIFVMTLLPIAKAEAVPLVSSAKVDIVQNTDPGQRILIIVPHPDDESLGTAGIIQKAVNLKRPIKVVIVTDGESSKMSAIAFTDNENPMSHDFYELGLERQKESMSAMAKLGLPKEDLIFLGFADGSIRFLWSDYWDNGKPRVSGGTQVAYSPYSNVYKPKIAYTGQNLENCLAEIMASFKPTDIYYPMADDMHPDHWGVSNFTRYTINALNLKVKEHMFLVHYPHWPSPWFMVSNKHESLLPLSDLKSSNTSWQSLPLDKNEEFNKEMAIRQYKSQMKVTAPFLLTFVRKNELFAVKAPIIVPKETSKPNLSPMNISHPLIVMNGGGLLNQRIHKSADIVKFTAFTYNNDLYLGLESLGPISNKVLYNFELRLFYEKGIKRIDLSLVNGKLRQVRKASNSIVESVITDHPIINKNTLWVKVKIPQEESLRYMFMGANVIYKNNLTDKVPWNIYKLEK